MNDLQNFIIQKGLEKASLEAVKQSICQDPSLPNHVKAYWLNEIKSYSMAKDMCDILNLLNGRG